MKKLLKFFQYLELIIILSAQFVNCVGDGHHIIWHMTHNVRDNLRHNSWDNGTFTPLASSNDYTSQDSFVQQIQTQNWNNLADQLQHFAKFGQFQAAYKELATDINYVGRLLQQAKPADQVSHSNIIELVEFASGSGSTSFQKSVAELLVKLEPYLLDGSGNIRQSLSWRESWRFDGIIIEFSNRTSEWYAYSAVFECGRSALGSVAAINPDQKELLSKYLNNTEIKQYLEMKQLLNKGDFCRAHSIAQKYGSHFKDSKQNYFLLRYQQEFNWKYNFQGIQKEYLATSYYKRHLTSLPASKVPSNYNNVIQNYLEKREQICGHTRALSDTTEQIVEKIIEIGPDKLQAVLEYFCKELCADHSNSEMVKSFNELSNHFGAPKWLRYNKSAREMCFNPALKTNAYAHERMLVAQIGLMDCPNEFGRIQTALNYLDRSCKPDEVSQKLAKLGHLIAQDILTGTYTQISLLPDFSKPISAEFQPIQDALIVLCADQFLKAQQNNEDVSPILIKNICHAYAGMERGKKVAIVFLQESLLPAACHMALNLEMPFEIYNVLGIKKQIEIGFEQVKARVDACRNIEKNGYIIAPSEDKFTAPERIALIKADIDILEAENFVGDQLERVDHHFRMLDLKALALANEQKFNPAVGLLLEFAVKSDSLCRLYMDYKQQGPMYAFGTLRSMAVASIKEMYRIDKEIVVGAAQGVWDGVKNVGHVAIYWQQTLTDMAQGIDSLATALDHCLWRVNEFAFDTWRHPKKAKKDFTTFYESSVELNNQIRQKIYDKGFAGCSRECAKFATETFLAGKLTDFAIAGCNAIEAQTNYLVDKYKIFVNEAESVSWITADGAEIRLTQKVENCVYNKLEQSNNSKFYDSSAKDVNWIAYRKHQPPKNIPWKELQKSTLNGNALYKPGINIRDLEMHAWKYGTPTTNGKTWKVFKAEEVIGANSGKETCYMRIECSANTIHGHPILETQYLELIK